MKTGYFLGLTALAGFLGIVISQIILPAVVSSFEGTLETMTIVDAVNAISYAAILLTFAGILLTITVLTKEYNTKSLYLAAGTSFILTILLLAGGSALYLMIKAPDVFTGANYLTKILKFYAYPTLVSLVLADPEPIWIISTVIYVLCFDGVFYYLSGGF